MCHLVFGPDKPPGGSGSLVYTCCQLATASLLDFLKKKPRGVDLTVVYVSPLAH